ncbi:MAG: hemerythrin domain-containing protein, partial [Bacteroidales bacterium]|nr:hemerythrin domain-containing protein [Bacteroidales bacterium]
QPCEDRQQKVIWKFFLDYKEELAKHFAYEEGQVFPYVEAVLGAQKSQFTIGEYEENHSNVEEKLEDLKNLVMKYIPRQCDRQAVYKVLFYIYTLEDDLAKHTFIEDDILVPMVGRMESHE